MDTPFEAYVTNLGKYNEGRLVGEFLKFPTTTEEVQALLKRIGIDGVRYEEIFITDYEVNISGLYDCLGEYESIDELNYLASLISEMDQSDREKFEAVIDSGEYSGSVKELINLTQNLDCFEFYAGVEDDETLGRIYVEDMEAIDVPEHLLNYFDYEAYGRDIRINDDGHYANGGYDLLADGKELASEDLVKAAAEAGISERTVQNAKRNMGGVLGARRVGGQWYNFIKKKQPPEPAS